MTEFDVSQFWGLFSYLDGQHKSHPETDNYAPYLFTMLGADSIKEIMEIYDAVLSEILSLSYGGRNNIPEDWFCNLPEEGIYLRDQLDYYLNICIKRLFDSREVTKEFAFSCLANLRDAYNHDPIFHHITVMPGRIVTDHMDEVDHILDAFRNISKAHYYINNRNFNEYIVFRSDYARSMVYLKEKGFIKTKREIDIEKKMFNATPLKNQMI